MASASASSTPLFTTIPRTPLREQQAVPAVPAVVKAAMSKTPMGPPASKAARLTRQLNPAGKASFNKEQVNPIGVVSKGPAAVNSDLQNIFQGARPPVNANR